MFLKMEVSSFSTSGITRTLAYRGSLYCSMEWSKVLPNHASNESLLLLHFATHCHNKLMLIAEMTLS